MSDSKPERQPETLQVSVCARYLFILEVAFNALQEGKLDDIVSDFWWKNFDELSEQCPELTEQEQKWYDAVIAYRNSKTPSTPPTKE